MSSIYHGLKVSMAKRVFQVIDHCTIYILIIGTYAPMLLTKVREKNPKFFLIFTLCEMAVATAGLVFTAIDFKKYRVISYAGYFIVGWSSVFAAKYVFMVFPKQFLYWIIAGGISYTFGMIFYARQRKHPYNHSVFHLFVLLGTVLHFIGIIVYCM
jgi:hemolysin III